MKSDKWRTTWELYSNVRELPFAERNVLLNSIDVDPEVLHEVTFLLSEPEEQAPERDSQEILQFASFGTGRYTPLEQLGRGGVGEVYSARDQQLDRIVALKFLLSGTLTSRSAERVMREAKALSSLNHPNIVTVYEVIQSAAGLAIVMELVEGTSLRSLCGDPLPEHQILPLGQQIAHALGAAHAQGVIHRDIKPENILVRPDGYVKVLDFGLARQIARGDSTSLHGFTVGTLRYMSPEQIRGEPLSPASDIFSLGLVLYELTVGKHPFAAESSIQTAYSIATKATSTIFHPDDRPSGERLERLIGAMLAKDPAGRPSAAKVAEELGAILLESSRPAVLLPPKRTARIWRTALAMSLLAIALATWFGIKKREAPEFADLRIEPLTSQGGWELAPALSPDGQSIAFTWSDKLNGVRDIYVKRFSENDPVRITNESQGLIGYLAWSPDGKQIAFKHSIREYGNPGTISSIAVTGGKKRKLFDLANSNLSSALDWSPDGTELAFSENIPGTERLAIYLLNLKTGKTRKVTSPPPDDWGDWNPKFSPDGSTLAFKRVSGFWADDIYLVDRNGNALRRLTTRGRGIWGHAWVPDGKSLLVSCQRTGSIFGIWRFPLASDTQPERISVGGIDAISPTSSKKRNRIAWVSQLWDLNIYRTAITGAGVPLKLIASTLRDQGGTYSPDGRIAFVSDRSGSREIWLANGDGSGQVRVTDLKGPPVDDLQWSPDGRELAFTSRIADQVGIFALSCFADKMNCGKPRRLTSQVSDGSPAWSRDGSLLYFASRREGDWNIWAQPLRGGPIRKVTKTGGYTSRESPDGKWLYFSIPRVAAIYRVPLPKLALQNISSAELVVGAPYIVQSPGWALTRHEVIFIDRAAQDRSAVIRAYNPDTKVMRSIVSLNEVFADRSDIGISVSPDEKWILYSQLDRSGSNVMLAESR